MRTTSFPATRRRAEPVGRSTDLAVLRGCRRKPGRPGCSGTCRQHPDCRLRSIKELHYFDMLEPRTAKRAQRRMLTDADRGAAGRSTPAARRHVELRDAEEWLRRDRAERRGSRRLFRIPSARQRRAPAGRRHHARLRAAARGAPCPDGGTAGGRALSLPAARPRVAAVVAGKDAGAAACRQGCGRHAARGAPHHVAPDRQDRRRRQGPRAIMRGAIGRLRAVVPAIAPLDPVDRRSCSARGWLALLHRFLGIREVPGNFDRNVHEGVPLVSDRRR